jgi:uncharacterized protein
MTGFEPVSLEGQDRYLELLGASGITASDYSFINLWGWAEEHGLQWSFTGDLVWIRQTKPAPVFWAPVGRLGQVDWPQVFDAPWLEHASFTRVPEAVVNIWAGALGGRVEAQDDRGNWDYVYSVPELVALSGNRFHKKKNLVNQFNKKFASTYVDLGPALIGQTRDMQEKWCVWRDCESSQTLMAENRAIERVLLAWESLRNIMGGALQVDSRLVAFCIAEAFRPDTLVIHFEKGFTEFTGSYQAMNQTFLAAHREHAFVNREQDLDEEGLRQAKLSYNPVDFVRKYRVAAR